MGFGKIPQWALILAVASAAGGCSVRRMAVNSIADALAGGASVYASDGDLELVREAMPFGLKTIEGLLVDVPRHRGLLVTASSGFTQFAFMAAELEAEELRDSDPQRSRALRRRAKELYLRGRDYGFRALDLRRPGFREMLERDADAALASFGTGHVEEMYWTAVAWSAAIASDKEDLDLVADLHLIEHLTGKLLELDESFDRGALHEFLIAFEGGRSEAQGGSLARARGHFERAVQLSGGRRLGPFVSLAENVSVAEENPREFDRLLRQVASFDLDRAPEHRLANLVAQRRARMLLARIDELFIDLSALDEPAAEVEVGLRTGAIP